jgi:hypothetical protein
MERRIDEVWWRIAKGLHTTVAQAHDVEAAIDEILNRREVVLNVSVPVGMIEQIGEITTLPDVKGDDGSSGRDMKGCAKLQPPLKFLRG